MPRRPASAARAAHARSPVERLEPRTLLAVYPGAQLAADINFGTALTEFFGGADVNGTLLFRSPDTLFRSDGTAAGTVPVRTGLYLQDGSFHPTVAAGNKA